MESSFACFLKIFTPEDYGGFGVVDGGLSVPGAAVGFRSSLGVCERDKALPISLMGSLSSITFIC